MNRRFQEHLPHRMFLGLLGLRALLSARQQPACGSFGPMKGVDALHIGRQQTLFRIWAT
jgi:hypothetical protein